MTDFIIPDIQGVAPMVASGGELGEVFLATGAVGTGMYITGFGAVGTDGFEISSNLGVGNLLRCDASGLNFVNGDFSISFWILPLSIGTVSKLLGKTGHYLIEHANGYVYFRRFCLVSDALYDVLNGGPSKSDVALRAPVSVAQGVWNHVVATSTNRRLTVRVSRLGEGFGAQAECSGFLEYSVGPYAPFYVNETLNANFGVDEIRVFSRALNDAEQEQLFNAGA